jgi:3-phenylpropionate/trans-cinnamate dioxygenase ferredoxin subunit
VRFELFREEELRPGTVREVKVGDVSVAVLRKHDGTYRALRNRCPHQGGPLADGRVAPLIEGDAPGEYIESKDREVVRCPWHQWEFDVDSGSSPADPAHYRVRAYEVIVDDGRVFLERRAPPTKEA